MKNPEYIAPPADLATLFHAAGLTATLAVVRQDGAPLTEADRALLPVLIEGYELGRELHPTEAEINASVAQVLKTRGEAAPAPLLWGCEAPGPEQGAPAAGDALSC